MRAVISPHLDDGVLSCGDLLSACPGTMLLTVFAGRPRAGTLTSWDRASGFCDGDDVIGLRRREDNAACVLLGAQPCWLPYVDAQYEEPAGQLDITAAIGAALDDNGVRTVVLPLGLYHDDHRTASDAALDASSTRAARLTTYVYGDWPYHELSGAVEERLTELAARGVELSPLEPTRDRCQERKRRAIGCYRSQRHAFSRRGLVELAQSLRQERYWMVRWR